METSEFWVGGFLLVIIFTGVNAAIQIGEQFSNRFNALIVLARRRIQCFRFFDIACFNRVGKGFGVGHQLRGFRHDIRFICSNCTTKT
ncbi:Uncharacterised protein [Shigella sonnei]|nr:Uncharacterised protein [Shigella sonnei]